MIVLDALVPITQWVDAPWTYVGVLPLVLGLVLNIRSALLFRRRGTPLKPGLDATRLVDSEAFRYSRNPMYLGFILILGGVALLMGSMASLLVPPLFAWIIQWQFIVREEEWMEKQFGDVYRAYKNRTRRWL